MIKYTQNKRLLRGGRHHASVAVWCYAGGGGGRCHCSKLVSKNLVVRKKALIEGVAVETRNKNETRKKSYDPRLRETP